MRAMKQILAILSVVLTCVITTELYSSPPLLIPSLVTEEKSHIVNVQDYDMKPNKVERLLEPLDLPHCPWIRIVEWRASFGKEWSGPSLQARNVLGKTCQKAVKHFSFYLKSRGYVKNIDINIFHQSLCLMPSLVENDGSKFRNLNDVLFRFRDREKTYDAQGKVNIIWGYTDFRSNTIYMRNDIINEFGLINSQVITVFAHELYHAMSGQFRIISDLYHNDGKIEENMAINFTKFLGYGI